MSIFFNMLTSFESVVIVCRSRSISAQTRTRVQYSIPSRVPTSPSVPHGGHSQPPANVFDRQSFHKQTVPGPRAPHTVPSLSLQYKHAIENRERTPPKSPPKRDDGYQEVVQLVLRAVLTYSPRYGQTKSFIYHSSFIQ